MNLVAIGLMTIAVGAPLAAAAGAFLPARNRPVVTGLLTCVLGVGGVLAGIGAVGGQVLSLTVGNLLPLSSAVFSVDPLSGIFMLLIGGVSVAAGIYSIGYTSPGGIHAGPADETEIHETEIHETGADSGISAPAHTAGSGAASRTTQAMLPVFVASMLLVPAAANITTFLILWELMALSSLALVLSEHRERPAVREAGLWYAAMTQAGLVAILLALVIFASGAGGESFTALREGAANLSPATRSLVFVLAFVGFGSKAGMVPLHVWLPRAHPEAPSHVSALMSAAMVKLGIYGLIRVWLDLLGGGPQWWGVLVLTVGALSALYGVLQASVSTDLKRLLGYSTTENIGLILMAIGAAAMFATDGNRTLASLLMAAALLHSVNHAGFKTLLFLGAGSVLRATGLRDLDRLGGLAARMPATTALVGFGALGAAALPPGNGFVSEWLLLQGFTHSLSGAGSPDVIIAVTMPLAVGVVALTAGLGVMTYVKAFGVGFLARPRSKTAASAIESPLSMRVGMTVAALACAALALAPSVAAGPLTRVVAILPTVRDGAPVGGDAVTLRLAGITGSMSPLLIALGLVVGMIVIALLARRIAGGLPRRSAPLWGCGGTRLDPRMEYTATSFAEPLTRVFDNVLRPEQDLNVTHHAESQYLIESIRFRQRVPDRIEARLYPPMLATANWWGQQARKLQNGSVHRYLAYGFIGLLAVLIVVGLTA